MKLSQNHTVSRENTAFIYSGLTHISDGGRKRLKNIAQSLIALQNRPGVPVPENICRDIMRESVNESF